jgi:hypothetical protein
MPKYTRRTIQEGLKWESIWKETPLTSVYMQESEILTVMSNYSDDAEFSFGTGLFSRECTLECLAHVGRMPHADIPVCITQTVPTTRSHAVVSTNRNCSHV